MGLPSQSCDKWLIRATSALYFVMSPPVIANCGLSPVVTVTHAVPLVLGLSLSLSAYSLRCPRFFLSTAHGSISPRRLSDLPLL